MHLNELKSLMVFISVVELGSFVQAAEKMNMTRSAVSKMIAKLEQQLGVVLFVRTTRQLVLTHEGAIYYEYSQRAMHELNTAEALLENKKEKVTGLLRISMPVLFGQKYMVPILKALAELQPELNFELSFTDRRVDLIEENIDLAIRIGHLENTSHLIAKPLDQHSMLLCASALYLKKHGAPLSVDDLAQHQTIAYAKSGHIQKWQFKYPHSTKNNQIIEYMTKSQIHMDDMQAILNAILMDYGIAWLPSWLVYPYLNNGQLVQVLEHYPSLDYPIQLVWKQSNFLPLRIRVTIDSIVNLYQQVPIQNRPVS